MHLSSNIVIARVSDAILKRAILEVRYEHTSDQLTVDHRIAPFDIGTTTLKNIERFANNLYAYSYTRIDRKTNRPDPRIVTFNINNFIKMTSTDDVFDETDLAIRHFGVSRYDYRNCNFALVPNRKWFQ